MNRNEKILADAKEKLGEAEHHTTEKFLYVLKIILNANTEPEDERNTKLSKYCNKLGHELNENRWCVICRIYNTAEDEGTVYFDEASAAELWLMNKKYPEEDVFVVRTEEPNNELYSFDRKGGVSVLTVFENQIALQKIEEVISKDTGDNSHMMPACLIIKRLQQEEK